MPVYDTSLAFCTEGQVEGVGGYDWDTSGNPDEDEVYVFAQWAAGQVTLATQRAGARYAPPASGVSDVALRNQLVQANAVGAAFMAWRVMAKGGDSNAVQMRDSLREDWIQFIGGTSAAGETVIGSIAAAVAAAGGTTLMRSDETAGLTSFPSTTTVQELGRSFSDNDED